MNNQKQKFLKKYLKHDDEFSLVIFESLLSCLSEKEIYQLSKQFNLSKEKWNLIIKTINFDLNKRNKSSSINFIISDIEQMFDKLDYFKKLRAAKLVMALSLKIKAKKTSLLFFLAKKFIQSGYTYIRYYGYKIFFNQSFNIDQKILEENWVKYEDLETVELLVNSNLSSKKLFDLFGNGDNIYNEYSFETKILRNKYFGKVMDIIPDKIKRLRKDDPISFAYVSFYSGNFFTASEAFNLYKENPSESGLIKVFGKMKLWKVIEKIAKEKNKGFLLKSD